MWILKFSTEQKDFFFFLLYAWIVLIGITFSGFIYFSQEFSQLLFLFFYKYTSFWILQAIRIKAISCSFCQGSLHTCCCGVGVLQAPLDLGGKRQLPGWWLPGRHPHSSEFLSLWLFPDCLPLSDIPRKQLEQTLLYWLPCWGFPF